jgi:hypothetical protein
VVVVSDDAELRLGACELLMGFLHPLEWPQVYVPTIPDGWLELLSNPFPCVLGLRPTQLAYLPSPRPASMLILNIDEAKLSPPPEPPVAL